MKLEKIIILSNYLS